jgi:hypothetical protein
VGDLVSIADAITELKTVTDLHVVSYLLSHSGGAGSSKYAISIWHEAGFVIDTAGTANTFFRLSTSTDTERLAPVATDRIRACTPSATQGTYLLVLED